MLRVTQGSNGFSVITSEIHHWGIVAMPDSPRGRTGLPRDRAPDDGSVVVGAFRRKALAWWQGGIKSRELRLPSEQTQQFSRLLATEVSSAFMTDC